MQLTNEKIEVTHQMMVINNMTRYDQYGVPVDPINPTKGLKWKSINTMTDEDFDKIEEYFINKTKK